MNIDLYLFNLINGFAGKWAWLDYSGMFFAKYFEYFLLAFLIILIAIYPIKSALGGVSPEAKQFNRVNFKKYWRMVFVSLVAGIVSRFIVGSIIRFLWFRPRPFVFENFIPLVFQNPAEASFPSGHALFYFALSAVIYLYNKKLGVAFYVASFLIVISRVFVGIHWPSDILAGAIIGILVGLVLNKIFKKYENYIFRSRGGV